MDKWTEKRSSKVEFINSRRILVVLFISFCSYLLMSAILLKSAMGTYLNGVSLISGSSNYKVHTVSPWHFNSDPIGGEADFPFCSEQIWLAEYTDIKDQQETRTYSPTGQVHFCWKYAQDWNNRLYGEKGSSSCCLVTKSGNYDSGTICFDYQSDLLLLAGSVVQIGCFSCSEACIESYGNCGLAPPSGPVTYETTMIGNSELTVRLDCQGERTNKVLQIQAEATITEQAEASWQEFQINGIAPTSSVKRYGRYDSCSNLYNWNGAITWDIPIPEAVRCGDNIDVTPSFSTGYGSLVLRNIVLISQTCDLKISSFSGNKTSIDPSAGESVSFFGEITGAHGGVTWQVNLTDSAGATWRTFNGSGQSVSVEWDGKDSSGTIANEGTYAATLEAKTAGGSCVKTASTQVTVKSPCSISSLTISPSEVWPARTAEGLFTRATLGINLVNPAPSSGCVVRLRIEPAEGSGGHSHVGNRMGHAGVVEPALAVFVPGESILNAVYKSGEVGGQEKIIAEILDGGGNIISTVSATVDVRVPELQPLETFFFYAPPMFPKYQLAGGTDLHQLNHYGTVPTLTNIGNLTNAYYLSTFALLGINDMSLERGGLFDICGTWNSADTCPNQLTGGHKSHRKGTGVDINRCALSTITNFPSSQTCVTSYNILGDPVENNCDEGYVCVSRRKIKTLCWDNGRARLDREDTYHCEFP